MAVESLEGHTPDHRNCPACEASRRLVLQPAELGALTFEKAAPIWLREHDLDISQRTHNQYVAFLRPLKGFFGALALGEIHAGHIEQYQKWRQQPGTWRGQAWKPSAATINREVNTLSQILQRAGLWTEIEKFYRPLRERRRKRAGQALDPQRERALFDVGPTNPYWQCAYWGALLMRNTGAGEEEVLNLRLSDVDEERRSVRIFEGIKNDYRERVLPLTAPAWQAVRFLLKRAKRCGSYEPEHFLFPARSRARGKKYDPTRHQTSFKHAWQGLRAAAGMDDVRLYDLRRTALTHLYEQPDVSDPTCRDIAGHMNGAMEKTYSFIRLELKRQALEKIQVAPAAPQLDLNFTGRVVEFPAAAGGRKK